MKGQKTGGRKKGTPNFRSTHLVQTTLDRLRCDPIEILALIAINDKNPIGERRQAAADLANYLHAKRKAIEHSGPDGGAIELNIRPAELLARKVAELTSKAE